MKTNENKKSLKLEKIKISKLQNPNDIVGGGDLFPSMLSKCQSNCLLMICNSTLTEPIDGDGLG